MKKRNFNDEEYDLRKRIVEHIIELYKKGMSVDKETLCDNYTLVCTDGSYAHCDLIREFRIECNENGEWLFYLKDGKGMHIGSIWDFSIETLKDILYAMQ